MASNLIGTTIQVAQNQSESNLLNSQWEAWIRDGLGKATQRFPAFRLKGVIRAVRPNMPSVSKPSDLTDAVLLGWVDDQRSGAIIESTTQGARWDRPKIDHRFDDERDTRDVDFGSVPFDMDEADRRCKEAGFNDPYVGAELRAGFYLFHENRDTNAGWTIELATGIVRPNGPELRVKVDTAQVS